MRSTSSRELQHCTAAASRRRHQMPIQIARRPGHGSFLASSVADLVVRRRREVAVPQPTATKGSGDAQADHFVGLVAPTRWHVDDAPTGTATMMRAGCCWRTAVTAARMVEPVARPSSTRMTVLLVERNQRPGAAIETLATFELDLLPLGDLVDHVRRECRARPRRRDSPAGHRRWRWRPSPVLHVPERRACAPRTRPRATPQGPGHLVTDRHAAPRQCQHDHVIAIGQPRQPSRKEIAGLSPVAERLRRHLRHANLAFSVARSLPVLTVSETKSDGLPV